jgi:hypothetical protein
MHFMNEYEIDDVLEQWSVRRGHPILGPAAVTLFNLKTVANQNSDGWAYWPKPARAANKLMTLIEGDRSYDARFGDREDVTVAQLKAAYAPIKAFLTRSGLTCEIVMPDPAETS